MLQSAGLLYHSREVLNIHELNDTSKRASQFCHLYAILAAALTSLDTRERTLYRTITNVHQSVMFQHMNIEIGELYGIPEISVWQLERRQDIKHSRTEEEFRETYGDQGVQWNRSNVVGMKHPIPEAGKASCIRFVAKGKMSGATVSILNEKSSKENKGMKADWILAPLETFLVEKVFIDDDDGILTIHLASRGTLLHTDNELVQWRQRVEKQQVTLCESWFTDRISGKESKTQAPERFFEPSDIAYKQTRINPPMSCEYSEESYIYVPRELIENSSNNCSNCTASIGKILEKVSDFHEMKCGEYSPHALFEQNDKTVKPFPFTMRLAMTFLHQLGRIDCKEEEITLIPSMISLFVFCT